MNIYFIKDRETNNFLVNPKKWTTKIYLAKEFRSLPKAKETRSKIKNNGPIPRKYDIIEYELVERRSL